MTDSTGGTGQLVWLLKQLGLSEAIKLRRVQEWGWEGIIRGHFLTRCLQVIDNLGLLDEFRRGPVNVRSWASEKGWDGDLLAAICDALYARRVLTRRDDSTFALDRDGIRIAETDLMRGWLRLTYGYENVLTRMEDLVTRKIIYGKDLERDGEAVAVGSGKASASFYFRLALGLIREGGYGTVLDIGCGDGTFLRYVCNSLPDVQGVGLDLSEDAVRSGLLQCEESGMERRIRLFQGDAVELATYSDQISTVEAATSFFVLHELASEDRRPLTDFLRSFRKALPGVPLILFETIRPDPKELRRRPGPAVEYFLFHDLSKQNPLNREEWKRVFRDAGFEKVEERYLDRARSSIFTLR